MSHFAKTEDGIVTQVIVAEQGYIDTLDDKDTWMQTSYNSFGGVHYDEDREPDGGEALRKNFAGIGFSYDAALDAFIAPKPYPSWTLNEDTCLWEAPVTHPDDGLMYTWDEETLTWIEVTD
jgi:hypothetical protein